MKFNVTVECTPAEARSFFGLPDVEPMQREIMDRMKNQILSTMTPPDLETLMKQWVTMPGMGIDMMQKAFGAVTSGVASSLSPKKK